MIINQMGKALSLRCQVLSVFACSIFGAFGYKSNKSPLIWALPMGLGMGMAMAMEMEMGNGGIRRSIPTLLMYKYKLW